jgi:hypothetical protein
MLRSTAFLLFALAAPCAGSAQTAAGPSATRQTASILDAANSAIETCLSGITTGKMAPKADVEIYAKQEMPGFKNFSALPGLISRFVATTGGGSAPDMVLQFHLTEGQIWAVVRASSASCDLAFSGFGDANVEAQIAGAFSDSAGWTTVAERPRSASAPLGQYLFVKRLPTASAPAFGARAKMRSMGTTPASADGIQMDINFLAGDLQLPAASAAPAPISR